MSLDPVWTAPRAQADIHLASIERLKFIVSEQQAIALVWPEEGCFLPNGDWKFNKEHMPPHYDKYEPLLCDVNTASMIVKLYDTINGMTTKGDLRKEVMLRQIAESRAYFAKYAEFCWKHASFK